MSDNTLTETEWWYQVPADNPKEVARAQTAYIARFGVSPSTPRRRFAKGGCILAYALPTPRRMDAAGRDVTDLPGLHDESDRLIQPVEPAQLTLLEV